MKNQIVSFSLNLPLKRDADKHDRHDICFLFIICLILFHLIYKYKFLCWIGKREQGHHAQCWFYVYVTILTTSNSRARHYGLSVVLVTLISLKGPSISSICNVYNIHITYLSHPYHEFYCQLVSFGL